MERYRSGHNGADSKSVCLNGHAGSNPALSATKSTVIYYGGLFLCHKMLNNKNFRLFRYIVSPEAKVSRSDTEFISSVVSQYFSSFAFCFSDRLLSSSVLLRDCRC